MGDQGVGRTAFKRIDKFNDDKTEQVWELFREEFARASVAEDGETSWRVAAGIMSIDEINKSITEEDAATIISDIASSSSATIQRRGECARRQIFFWSRRECIAQRPEANMNPWFTAFA